MEWWSLSTIIFRWSYYNKMKWENDHIILIIFFHFIFEISVCLYLKERIEEPPTDLHELGWSPGFQFEDHEYDDDQDHEEEMRDDRDHDLLMIIRRIMIRFMGIFHSRLKIRPQIHCYKGRLSNSGRWMTALYKCNLSKIHDSFVAFTADFTTRSWNLTKCKRLSVRWSNSLI